uniref:Uncharacterized protein n=1 Tax=Chenopodium quinoa TaxID=63459 RepID=A0A803N5J9_CHEQI
MYQHYQHCADQVETKLKKADDACKGVIKKRDKVKADMKLLQRQVSDLNKKLLNQENLQKQDMNHSPTSYEGEYFDELPPNSIITNLDPRELPKVEFDDALIGSPVAVHADEKGLGGPLGNEAENDPGKVAEKEAKARKD